MSDSRNGQLVLVKSSLVHWFIQSQRVNSKIVNFEKLTYRSDVIFTGGYGGIRSPDEIGIQGRAI